MNEKKFNLTKVKLDPKGGLLAEYEITTIAGDEPTTINRKETCTREVHPDLSGLFKSLREVVRAVFGMTESTETAERVEVRGLSWSGSEANEGVIITSVFECVNGSKTCINTPRIKLAQDSFGFEEDLKAICEDVKNEVYAYLFDGKQAQLSLFGDSPDEEPEE